MWLWLFVGIVGWMIGFCSRMVVRRLIQVEIQIGLLEGIFAFSLVSLVYDYGWSSWRVVLISFLVVECCVLVALIDFLEGYIYLNLLAVFSGLRLILVSSLEELVGMILAVLVAVALYGGIYFFGRWVFQKEALGQGDIYFLACLALWLNWREVILVGLGAFWLALAVVIVYYCRYHCLLRTLAFAPMMSLACFLVYFFGDWLVALYWQWLVY